MTHFELDRASSNSTFDIIREARSIMSGHTLRIFSIGFGLSLLWTLMSSMLNANPDGRLSEQIAFLLISLSSLVGNNVLAAMTANITAARRLESSREFQLDSSRVLKLLGLYSLWFVVSIPVLTLIAVIYAGVGALASGLVIVSMVAYLQPIFWLSSLAILEHDCGPIDAIRYVFEGLKGRYTIAASALGIGVLIAGVMSLTIVGVIWALPFGYFLASTVYCTLITAENNSPFRITPTIQIQMPRPTRRVVRML